MAKAISAVDVFVDAQLVTLYKTIVATYGQTKLVTGGYGTVTTIDTRAAEKIVARRALKKTYRGNTGFSGDSTTVGQIP